MSEFLTTRSIRGMLRRTLVHYAGHAQRRVGEQMIGYKALQVVIEEMSWLATVADVEMSARVPRSLRRVIGGDSIAFLRREIDKSTWGDGPWQSEPDRVMWMSGGLFCMILRGEPGGLCGYVGLPEGHPLHGTNGQFLKVHGGVTWAKGDGWSWWLGFDCGHGFDCSPGIEARLPPDMRERLHSLDELLPGLRAHTYRPIGYVRDEVESMVRQIALAVAKNRSTRN